MTFLSDAWDGIKDAVSNQTFLTILGSALTFGSYGYVTGVLSAAEQVAVEQGMNAAASAAVTYIKTGKFPKSFGDAWQGQLAYRTKTMLEAGGASYAAAGAAAVASIAADSAAVASLSSAMGTLSEYRDLAAAAGTGVDAIWVEGAKGTDAKRTEVLHQAQSWCAGQTPAKGAMACRQDSLAQIINLIAGRIIFDTSDWDPMTGKPRPPPPPKPPPTLAELKSASDSVRALAQAGIVPFAAADAVQKQYTDALAASTGQAPPPASVYSFLGTQTSGHPLRDLGIAALALAPFWAPTLWRSGAARRVRRWL